MASTDHTPLQLNKFGGLFNRGYSEDCPSDHFSDCLNVRFVDNTIITRNPATAVVTKSNIRRYHMYQKRNETSPRYIILNTSGQFFDSAVSLVTPFLTVAAATDFSCVTFYDRLYISPHDGKEGISGEFVYVYDGTTARVSAGAGPSTVPTFAAAGAGHVEEGIHLCAYAYETSSGFITRVAAGSSLDAAYVTARTVGLNETIEFNNVPIGPAGTVARWVLVSKRIDPLSYTKDTLGYEMFFATRIGDNVTTTYSFNKYDNELIQSADYIFDNMTSIPAGVCIGRYNDRLIVGGLSTSVTSTIDRQAPITDVYTDPKDRRSLIYVSNVGEPESISAIDGFVTVDPTEYSNIRCFAEFRKMLLITKSTQTYITQDNGDSPVSWEVVPIDKSIGSECFGLATTVLNRGSSSDSILIASYEGLMLYNGTMSEFPLTWKIQELWRTINKAVFNKVQVVQDGQSRTIYVNVPFGSATSPNQLLVGDYSKGLNYEDIRWSIWDFSNISVNPISIALLIDSNNKFQLAVGHTNDIYNIGLSSDVADFRDLGTTSIPSNIKIPPLSMSQDTVHHIGAVGIRYMDGPLTLNGYGDNVFTGLASMAYQTQFLNKAVWANIKGDKVGITVGNTQSNAAQRLNITEITIYIKELWGAKPI